jgi:serine/threonine protein kinase
MLFHLLCLSIVSPAVFKNPHAVNHQGYRKFTKKPLSSVNAMRSISSNAGHFEVIRKLGEGGFGVVEEVRDPGSQQKYARKTILNPKPTLFDEFDFTKSLQGNPHIVRVYSKTAGDNFMSYTMQKCDKNVEEVRNNLIDIYREYSEQKDFESSFKKYMELQNNLHQIAIQMLDALVYIHKQNVAHLDIKPSNMMLCDGEFILLDFGLAIAAPSGKSDSCNIRLSTIKAPESEASSYDPFKVDVFHLGYSLLTITGLARPPCYESQLHQTSNIASISSGSFMAFVKHLMACEPGLRPTAKEALNLNWISDTNFWKNEKVMTEAFYKDMAEAGKIDFSDSFLD